MKHIWLRVMALLLSLLMITAMVGCTPKTDDNAGDSTGDGTGNNTNKPPQGDTPKDGLSVKNFDPKKTYEAVDYFSLDIAKYVQLGRYSNLTLTVDPDDMAVSDEAVKNNIDTILSLHHPDAKITDREVKLGDTVIVDYVGKKDGVAFSGGTAYNQEVTVQSDSGYIAGFAEGLVGATPGVMKEVHVTFPENYQASDLAGKAVIFEMTVHYIVGDPELTDAFVVDYTEGEMTTAEQFTAAIRADMEEQARQSVLSQALWSKLNEISAVTEYPEEAVMYHYSYSYAYYSQYAAMFGMSYEAFLSYSGATPEYVFESCKALVKQDLVRHAIYAAEGLTCSEEEYQKTLDEYTEENYDDLRASMIASGKEDYTKEEAREYFDTNYKSQLKDTYLESVACERLLAKVTIQEIAS